MRSYQMKKKHRIENIGMIVLAILLIAAGMFIMAGCVKNNPAAPKMRTALEFDKAISPPYKLLCIGNSITFHPEYHGEFDWPGDWGMAAETQAQDYVHQLHGMLETYLQQSVGLEWTNDALGIETQSWKRGIKPLEPYFDTDANIIVIFFSDNTAMQYYDEMYFEEFYNKAISRFVSDDRLVVCVTTWFEDNVTPEQKEQKDNAIKRSCARNGIPWVDINGLYSENNYINTCWGEGRTYGNPAVDWHPGNIGMHRIAEEIFDVLALELP